MRRLLLACVLIVFATPALARNDNGRPAECPYAWCACWARMQAGLPAPFNLALHWLTLRHVGDRNSAPPYGSWAVMARRGGGHVGKVVGVDPNGNPILRSGNHGKVGVGDSVYPKGRIIAYVQP